MSPTHGTFGSALAPDLCKVRHLVPDALALRSWALLPPSHPPMVAVAGFHPCEFKPVHALSMAVNGTRFSLTVLVSGKIPLSTGLRLGALFLLVPALPNWAFTCRGVLGTGWLPWFASVGLSFRAVCLGLCPTPCFLWWVTVFGSTPTVWASSVGST